MALKQLTLPSPPTPLTNKALKKRTGDKLDSLFRTVRKTSKHTSQRTPATSNGNDFAGLLTSLAQEFPGSAIRRYTVNADGTISIFLSIAPKSAHTFCRTAPQLAAEWTLQHHEFPPVLLIPEPPPTDDRTAVLSIPPALVARDLQALAWARGWTSIAHTQISHIEKYFGSFFSEADLAWHRRLLGASTTDSPIGIRDFFDFFLRLTEGAEDKAVYDLALYYASKLELLATSKKEKAEALSHLGLIYAFKYNFAHALPILEEAAFLCMESGSYDHYVYALLSKGKIFAYRGEGERALADIMCALEASERLPKENQAFVRLQLHDVLYGLERLPEATTELSTVSYLCKNGRVKFTDDTREQLAIATLHFFQHRLRWKQEVLKVNGKQLPRPLVTDIARSIVADCIGPFTALSTKRGVARCWLLLAKVLDSEAIPGGKLREHYLGVRSALIREAAENALGLADTYDFRLERGQALSDLGWAAFRVKDATTACQRFARALGIFDQLGARREVARTLEGLGRSGLLLHRGCLYATSLLNRAHTLYARGGVTKKAAQLRQLLDRTTVVSCKGTHPKWETLKAIHESLAADGLFEGIAVGRAELYSSPLLDKILSTSLVDLLPASRLLGTVK